MIVATFKEPYENENIQTALCGLFLFQLSASAQTVLTYSDHEPYGNMRTRFLNEVFFQEVGKASQGRLKIQAHWGGEIAKAHGELAAVNAKKVDMITAVPEYSAQQLPLHQLFKSFAIGPVGQKQFDVLRKIYRDIPELTQEYERNHVKPVFIATGHPVAFFSTQKLNSLHNLKGQTWRSASFWHRDHLKNAGAVPVSSPWGQEVIDMFANGKLHGLMVNIDSAFDINADRYTPYALVSRELCLGHIYPVVIDAERWNALSKEDQQAFEHAAKTAYTKLGGVMDENFNRMLQTAKERNVQLRLLSKQEVADWGKMSGYREVQQAWVKEQQAKGVVDAEQVLAKMDAVLNPKSVAIKFKVKD